MSNIATASIKGKVSEAPQLRVIVMGCGIAGLALSDCLERAGIDYIAIERNTIITPERGASITIHPHGARILHQLGCLESVRDACDPCSKYVFRRPDATELLRSDFFQQIETDFAVGCLVLSRKRFVEILYECLPRKDRLRYGENVTNVRCDDADVEVFLRSGRSERGHLLIGADGAYSMARDFLWSDMGYTLPASVVTAEKRKITTSWYCLVGFSPNTLSPKDNDCIVVFNKDTSFHLLVQPTAVYFFVFVRHPTTLTWPARKRYSAKDVDATAAKVRSLLISQNVLFGDLGDQRHHGELVNLEEGVLDHWYSRRIVLVGDSAHKFTPNIALVEMRRWNLPSCCLTSSMP